MTKTMKKIVGLALFATAGMLAASTSFAATSVSSAGVFTFNKNRTTHAFDVRPHSWSDPAFGHQGWTHHARWAGVRARRGETVAIHLISRTAGVNPAATVWFRGARDTAPNHFVPDHFFHQLGDFSEAGVTDEATGTSLGNIVMNYVAHGYDRDGNSLNFALFRPITDGTPGHLDLTFTAPRTGFYMFAVGAINPDAAINTRLRYFIDGEVEITPAPAP